VRTGPQLLLLGDGSVSPSPLISPSWLTTRAPGSACTVSQEHGRSADLIPGGPNAGGQAAIPRAISRAAVGSAAVSSSAALWSALLVAATEAVARRTFLST
jgi:hypothetical protein